MKFIYSKRFQLIWSIWILLLGISLLFFHTLQYVNSFSEYLNAFLILDMPSSWCPTFLILYGITSLASPNGNKFFNFMAKFAGLTLLPIGIYTTVTYTLQSMSDPLFVYIYAQTIHISEFLTGLLTVLILLNKRR